jgi:hypothetical protein
VRFANLHSSWQIDIQADVSTLNFALWLRDVESIEVPRSSPVPGPLDLGDLPPPLGEPHDPRLGEEWLAWWVSLVDRRPRPPSPDDGVEPAHDSPDPLGLARLPALRGPVARRWNEFLHWQGAHRRAHGTFAGRRRVGDVRDSDTVRAVEAALGRQATPFRLTFTLLPVRDDRILPVEPAHYLVPERVYLGPGWPAWLHAVVTEIA